MDRKLYPDNWKEIAYKIKRLAGGKCERCGHPHDWKRGYCLTVHHLDENPQNCDPINLLACCQRCHLHLQGKPGGIEEKQLLLFLQETVPNWIKKFVERRKNYAL